MRKNSFAFCGGAFGDEGKGRIVDELVNNLSKKGPVVVYRDNGGANAGHTITLPNGQRIAMHQLPSGVFCKKAILVLGKGMVIHPGDFITEVDEVKKVAGQKNIARIYIDEMATLALDTHRAYESALKIWHEGGRAATGRGISPAYADVLLRQPLFVRDLTEFRIEKIHKHYRLYQALIRGLGEELSKIQVAALGTKELTPVGTEEEFIHKLKNQANSLKPYVKDAATFLQKTWNDMRYAFVFEKAQGIGLDYRWGAYPDITASDTTFAGILSSTGGIIHPEDIPVRAGVIKATYMSSVGTRILPAKMDEGLAKRIREDAHEYGATTGRPRDIFYLDLPALKYFTRVGDITHHVLTHMDISYTGMPIKVCVGYTLKGKVAYYRPDQEYLLKVKPVYKIFKPWNSGKIQTARSYKEIPGEAKIFINYLQKYLGTQIAMITTGSKRNQSIKIPKK